MTRPLPTSLLLAAAALLVGAFSATAQTARERLDELDTRFRDARRAAVHLLAPRAYSEADDRLEDLRRRTERGADDLLERHARAENALEVAEDAANRIRRRFEDALGARESAIDQNADGRVPDMWMAAEEELERGGREAERENFERAMEQAARAHDLYLQAALSARSDRLLGSTMGARQTALSIGASEFAPRTFGAGEAALSEGQTALSGGSDATVSAHAERASRAFERAAWLAAVADSIRNRTLSVERLIDAHEGDLTRVAGAASVEAPDLRNAGDATAEAVEQIILDLLARNERLATDLAVEQRTASQLANQVASLEEALTDSERRYSQSQSDLMARRRADQRLRETSALFTEDEGEVFINGDDLVLRLHGLTFRSGSDEVEESMEPLLAKVEAVLVEFSDADIRIEGHTDSQGNADRNRTLSQSRAVAVRDYLLSRLPISASRVEAEGLGEDRPIARNDTEAGRARNRRIEIILTVPE